MKVKFISNDGPTIWIMEDDLDVGSIDAYSAHKGEYRASLHVDVCPRVLRTVADKLDELNKMNDKNSPSH